MNIIHVNWVKCGDDNHWCDFYRLDLFNNLDDASGVYIIFYLGKNDYPGRVVRIGQGEIADRIREHRHNPEINAYKDKGLLVTWAIIPDHQKDGVEKCLADHFNPLVGERFPDRIQIKVNNPFK